SSPMPPPRGPDPAEMLQVIPQGLERADPANAPARVLASSFRKIWRVLSIEQLAVLITSRRGGPFDGQYEKHQGGGVRIKWVHEGRVVTWDAVTVPGAHWAGPVDDVPCRCRRRCLGPET